MSDELCPGCASTRTRRGGTTIWGVYILALLLAVPAVLLFHLNAALVGGVLLAVIALAHLVIDTRVCLDCGRQF